MPHLELKLHPVELPLRHAWTIAHGTRTVQNNLIVELSDPDTGLSGYGEAAAIPYFGVTVEGMVEAVQMDIAGEPGHETWIAEAYDRVEWIEGGCKNSRVPSLGWRTDGISMPDAVVAFLRCAVDQAAYDLVGKQKQQPTWRLFSIDRSTCPVSDYTIGMAEPEVMAEKLREFPDFPVYKIKLGTGSLATDLALVERLRKETDATFRVDANTAWTAEEAIRISGPLKQLGVEFIEQPLKRDLPCSEHEAVYFGSDLPIMADESCITEADVEACAGCFHGINIKLTKCGGMTPARRMIARARELDMKVMIGCMTETTVGISAIGQLLPLLDYVDMDGALLLAEDIADGVKVGPDGVAVFPDGEAGHGNGVTLTRDLPTV
ncbi:MAG: dipeptide epimerase [Planctomycetota bacterium]